jgi:hypothetical protein
MFSAIKNIRRISLKKRSAKIILALFLVLITALPPIAGLLVVNADAGTPSPAKVTINNSQAAATSVTYSVDFTATVSTAIQRLTVQFCTTASGSCVTPSGMTTTGASFVASNVNGTSPSHTFGGNGLLRTDWTPVTQNPLTVHYAVSGITNPSTANTTSYARIVTYSDAGTTPIDNVTVAFAVLDTSSIAVSATVDPNFTFTIAQAVTGSVNGDTINVSSTTPSSIPFGSLNTSTASVSAHDLTITTNASNGYTITASSSANAQSGNPPLISGATNNIDNFTGTNASPTSWSAPGGSSINVNTGFFGYTTNDATLCTGTANRFTSSGPNYAGFSTNGAEIACSSTPVTSETTRVGWKLAINALQPAGAYTGTIILVATPTY